DVELVVRLLVLNRNPCRQTGHGDTRGVSADVDRVIAAGAVDGDAVGLAVAGGAAECAGEVRVDRLHVGAGQVVDGHRVGAAEGIEVDGFDAAVSNVTLPGLRRNSRRVPLPGRANASATVAPLNTRGALPSW